MHQLGEDGRFPTESLENNVQHGCEEDVEQQRGKRESESNFETTVRVWIDNQALRLLHWYQLRVSVHRC